MNLITVGQFTINMDNVSYIEWYRPSGANGAGTVVVFTMTSIYQDDGVQADELQFVEQDAETLRQELWPFLVQASKAVIEL